MGWIARSRTWCAACGGYLLFAGVVDSSHELVTAVVLATAATTWAWAIRRCGHLRFELSPAHAVEWARAAASLGPAIVKTFPVFVEGALLGRSRGRLLEIPFRRGAERGAHDAARRAEPPIEPRRQRVCGEQAQQPCPQHPQADKREEQRDAALHC